MNTFSESALSKSSFYFVEHKFGERIMNPSDLFKILYVETSEDDGFLLETAIDCPSVEITFVKTVTEALKISQVENFNLILLETRFPDGCGFELCREIIKSKPHTPLIFYSGDAAEKDKNLGLAAGAKDYLVKPYFDLLTTTVGKYIGLNP
jgi:DNA-binding response OmpR family regulator